MTVVARLLTFVDLAAEDPTGTDVRRVGVSARHEAVLDDGDRVVLLDDRGWSSELRVAWDHEPSEQERSRIESTDAWAYETVDEMKETARVVVGPDEPFEGRTQADMHASHWEHLARVLCRRGIEIDSAELAALPHDVELSERVLARIAAAPSDALS